MRKTLVIAPEIASTHDCGALLLGAVLIFYLSRKRKMKPQKVLKVSSKGSLSRSVKDLTVDVTYNLYVLSLGSQKS